MLSLQRQAVSVWLAQAGAWLTLTRLRKVKKINVLLQIHENKENVVSDGPPRGPRRVPRRVSRRLFGRPGKRQYIGKRSVFASSGSGTKENVLFWFSPRS